MRNVNLAHCFAVLPALCALVIAGSRPVSAQQAATITASGTVDDPKGALPLTMTFPPAGGAVTGSASHEGASVMSITGSFVGGDGGQVSGTVVVDLQGWANAQGSWTGNFFANGTGSGAIRYEGGSCGGDCTYTAWQAPWHVTFSAQDFSGGLAPAITSQYIYDTYHIRVEDSMGDSRGTAKGWSDQELVMLNDVLRELPASFLDKLVLTSIVRNQAALDKHGVPNRGVDGAYTLCDRKVGNEECSAATATIRIFDSASDPYDFANDPEGRKQFKSTILHELTHAMQYYKSKTEVEQDPLKKKYRAGYSAPFMQNYMDATRDVTDIGSAAFSWSTNGWSLLNGQWYYCCNQAGNKLPTEYGRKNPKEDLSEAVKFYVYDPERLKSSSIKRYNFIRDQIFGGIEYEDGQQKKP